MRRWLDGSLTWDAGNWEKGGLTVLAKKTEHHGGEHAVPIVPICPELRSILADAFEPAEPGSTLVVPSAARATANLRTHLERIITKAGHTPWPRLLLDLRASCEIDWVEKSAQDGTERHETTEPAATTRVTVGFSRDRPPGGRAGSTQTRAMDGPAGVNQRQEAANNLRLAREIQGAAQPATHDATHFRPIGSS